MFHSSPSENILKLRELSNKLNEGDSCKIIENDYKSIVLTLKQMVEEGKNCFDINNKDLKLEKYEKLCLKIKSVLSDIRL